MKKGKYMKKLLFLACVGAFICTQETHAGAGRAGRGTGRPPLGTPQAQNQTVAQASNSLTALNPAGRPILSGATRPTFGAKQSDVSRLLSDARQASEDLLNMFMGDANAAIVTPEATPSVDLSQLTPAQQQILADIRSALPKINTTDLRGRLAALSNQPDDRIKPILKALIEKELASRSGTSSAPTPSAPAAEDDNNLAIVPYTGVPLNADDLFLPRVSFDTSTKDVDWKEARPKGILDDPALRKRQEAIQRGQDIQKYISNTTDRMTIDPNTAYARPINDMDMQLYLAQATQGALERTGADRKTFSEIQKTLRMLQFNEEVLRDLTGAANKEDVLQNFFYGDDMSDYFARLGLPEDQLAIAEATLRRFATLPADQMDNIVQTFDIRQNLYEGLVYHDEQMRQQAQNPFMQ
jgi:hypothetical protein